MDGGFKQCIPPHISIQTIELFTKQQTGSNIDVAKKTALKEFLKFPGNVLD